ncbi:MAG: SPOR domain-containing protein [Gemmatimonadota bacterium]
MKARPLFRSRKPWRFEMGGVSLAGVLLTAFVLAVQGCGGGGSGDEAGRRPLELEGAPLLVGSSLDQWSLVGVPAEGGTVDVRSVRDPSQTVREGSTALPASVEVRFVGERQVFLRTEDGIVLHYDPEADEVTRIGTVGSDPAFASWNGFGVYASAEGAALLEIGERDAWSFEVTGRPVWATPVEGGRVAVVVEEAEDGRSLWLLRRGDAEPESRTAAAYGPPGLATAWGRRLVFRSQAGDGLQFVAVPSLTAGPEVTLDGRVTALAASPSSHAIYAAIEDPARVVEVNRFSRASRDLGELEGGSITELRASALGQSVLAHDGDRVWWVPVGEAEPASTEAEWRSDLPTVLPDGRVLLVRNDGLFLWNPEAGSEPTLLEGASPDRAWGVVRWNPAPEPVAPEPDRVADATDAEEEEEEPGTPAAAEGDPAELEEERPEPAEADAPPETTDSTRVPTGFYAVASSARDPEGVEALRDDLESSGYPAAFQRHSDDAGRTWYRALVGPYPTRTGAEAAARQLRRERDLPAWVAEIGAGLQ